MIKFLGLFTLVSSFLLPAQVRVVDQEGMGLVKQATESAHLVSYKYKYDDTHSELIFNRYLDELDPSRVILSKEDISKVSAQKFLIDDQIANQQFGFGISAYKLFIQESIKMYSSFIEKLKNGSALPTDGDFDMGDSSRKLPVFSEDQLMLRQEKLLANDIIKSKIAETDPSELKEKLIKTYQKRIEKLEKVKDEDIVENYLNTLMSMFDPHSAYFSEKTLERFAERMSGEVFGIGTMIGMSDEGAVISEVIEGGPAYKQKALEENDIILSVMHKGEKVATKDLDLYDVIKMVKGPAGTKVTLEVQKPNKSVKMVTITRGKVIMAGSRPEYEVVTTENSHRIAVISISTFNEHTTSGTVKILKEIKDENIDGIVIDLIDNGGGYLHEAISLNGLFVKTANIVQTFDGQVIKVMQNENSKITYDGPLAVVVNNRSASASEITAGFMKDYKRAILIGERTFGKGTVQNIIDFRRMNPSLKFGIKLTTSSFHRPNGKSTQHDGVKPDIAFPTAKFSKDSGERKLKNSLKVKAIPSRIEDIGDGYEPVDQGAIADSKRKMKSRVSGNKVFNALYDLMELYEKDETVVSLSLKKRLAKNKVRERKLLKSFNVFLTAAGMQGVEDLTDAYDRKNWKVINKQIKKVQYVEAANILSDYIQLAN